MSLFTQNLAALAYTHPRLADWMQSVHIDPAHYKIMGTRSGYPTLEIPAPQGKSTLLHSQFNPLAEAERQITGLNPAQIYMPLFAGMGLGYAVKWVWENYRENFYDLLIVEQDPFIFRCALEAVELQEVLRHPRTRIHVGSDLSAWKELISAAMPAMMSSALRVIPHPSLQRQNPAFYKAALDIVAQKMQQTKAEIDFMIHSGPQIHENLWRNLPTIADAYGVNAVRGCLAGQPAIVCAAGPSLDKNIQQLRDRQAQYPIIAVDTAFRTLQKNGIVPDIVVAADPTPLNTAHFEDTRPRPETILAFNPEVYHTIPSRWPGLRLFLNLDKEEFTRWLERRLGPFGYNPKGGSVGHTAFFLAQAMQADPIIFLGLDLSFDPQGGATHTAHSALKRAHQTIPKESKSVSLGSLNQGGARQEPLVWVPGVCQDSVPTSPVMHIYIQQFAEQFATHPGTVIDATEGGALIPGSIVLSLKDALRQAPGGAYTLLSAAPPTRPLTALRQDLSQMQEILLQAQTRAAEGIQKASHLMRMLHQGPALRQTPLWDEMNHDFDAIYHNEMMKIALGQALFGAITQFVQKEHPSQVESRVKKYLFFFHTVLKVQPHFSNMLAEIDQQMG
ncbi:MAG: DUF115 domain-containing protein [bacterium]|jgi:hypothetical protein|nr:DUF115 domain-containing protein [bacterium]